MRIARLDHSRRAILRSAAGQSAIAEAGRLGPETPRRSGNCRSGPRQTPPYGVPLGVLPPEARCERRQRSPQTSRGLSWSSSSSGRDGNERAPWCASSGVNPMRGVGATVARKLKSSHAVCQCSGLRIRARPPRGSGGERLWLSTRSIVQLGTESAPADAHGREPLAERHVRDVRFAPLNLTDVVPREPRPRAQSFLGELGFGSVGAQKAPQAGKSRVGRRHA